MQVFVPKSGVRLVYSYFRRKQAGVKWEQHIQTTLSRNFPAKGRREWAQDLEDLSQGRASVSLLVEVVITTSSRAPVSDSRYG